MPRRPAARTCKPPRTYMCVRVHPLMCMHPRASSHVHGTCARGTCCRYFSDPFNAVDIGLICGIGALLASPRHPEWAQAVPAEGYVFIALGPCSLPGYDCLFLREVREAIGALRAVDPSRPIAAIGDGGIPAAELLRILGCDLVKTISDSATSDGACTLRPKSVVATAEPAGSGAPPPTAVTVARTPKAGSSSATSARRAVLPPVCQLATRV